MSYSAPMQVAFAIDSNVTVGYVKPNIGQISKPTEKQLLPIGQAFQLHATRFINNWTLAEQEASIREELELKKSNSKSDVDDEIDDGVGDEPESRYLLELDPRDWKNQDQYAVLGLSALRWKATPDQIKRAHRKKVLRHHPDKKAGQAGNANDDSFFKCIAKAHEVLSDSIKRRQFDSIDKEIDDDDVPSEKDVSAKPEAFFELYRPVFEREARFSINQPIPDLGDLNSTRQQVEDFYDFWLKFDSWRSFEWKDKDANEGSDSRTEKRHIENKNRSERERRKKEDNARRRNLVETALSLDPRMKRFKAEERLKREAKKKGANPSNTGTVTPSLTAEEIKQKAEAEAQAQAELDKKTQDEKSAKENAKKAKEAIKKNIKKEKKSIQSIIVELNYFSNEKSVNPTVIENQLIELDLLASELELNDLVELRKQLEIKKSQDKTIVKSILIQYAKKVSDESGKVTFKHFV